MVSLLHLNIKFQYLQPKFLRMELGSLAHRLPTKPSPEMTCGFAFLFPAPDSLHQLKYHEVICVDHDVGMLQTNCAAVKLFEL